MPVRLSAAAQRGALRFDRTTFFDKNLSRGCQKSSEDNGPIQYSEIFSGGGANILQKRENFGIAVIVRHGVFQRSAGIVKLRR
jgi:hypothetical protein